MPGKNDLELVSWAEGTGNNLAKSKNKTESWGSLKRMLSKPFVTPERRKQFDKMPKDEQDKLKAINGWICGARAKDNKRTKANLQPRNLLTIDIDYAGEEWLDKIELGTHGLGQYEAFWHSSRRHTLEAPRVRLFMPMSREVGMDEYLALSRFAGWLLDPTMKLVDYVSYRPAQMMFKPSCSSDDKDIFFKCEQFGKIFDPDEMLAAFDKQFGSWMDLGCLPRSPDEEILRQSADKAEDPRSKQGPVGIFCRTYDIFQAMEEFLPNKYIPGDEHSGHPRFTYAGSTSSNGAIVYDDGLFLFSHHGHDPVGDMNVNAFDLVRIHLFGDLDAKAAEGTTPGGMPSYKALIERLKTDKKFQATRRDERFGDMKNAFSDEEEDDNEEDTEHRENREPDEDDDDDVVGTGPTPGGTDDLHAAFDSAETDDGDVSHEPTPERPPSSDQKRARPKPSSPRAKPADDWFNKITISAETGQILQSLNNAAVILQSDPRMYRAIRFNEFLQKPVLARTLNSKLPTYPKIEVQDKANGDKWQDHHEVVLRAMLDLPPGQEGVVGYGFQATKINIDHAITMAARSAPFHPVKDYILKKKWDGKSRVDSMLVRYLGVQDTDYHRQISRLMLVASVTRIFEPGHKFDFAVIIQGSQGLRKSSFIQTLYGEKWFGELHVDLGEQQRVAEAVMGKWGVELPELGSLHKSDHNKAKAFMRQQRDDVRLAYEKNSADLPRQFICWGTTNDKKYLRDPTGNRSFWPAVCGKIQHIDTDALAAERDQLWAEAFEIYWDMREKQPKGTLPLYLHGKEANAEALELQEGARTEELHETWADAIRGWLETPILYNELVAQIVPEGTASKHVFSENEDENPMVLRTAFTQAQAVQFALHRSTGKGVVGDNVSNINVTKAVDLIEGWAAPRGEKGTKGRRIMGAFGRWIENQSASPEDRAQGYSVIEKGDDDVI